MSTETLPKIERARRQLIPATQALQQLQVDSPELILQMRERTEDRKFGIIMERWVTAPQPHKGIMWREVVLIATPWASGIYAPVSEHQATEAENCKAMVDFLRTGHRSKP